MRLVFIYGMPGAGKLTVAKELNGLTGYRLFHNHLVVDMLLHVFEFGSQNFIELREKIWLEVFRSASISGAKGLIFTFAPEKTVRQKFIENVVLQAKSAGDEIVFVELFCDQKEIERRLAAEERKNYMKLASVEFFRELKRTQTFDSPKMPPAQLRLDTGRHSARVSAATIAHFLTGEKGTAAKS